MINKNGYILLMLLLLTAFSSCEDYYNPEVEETEPFLVVQGMLTDHEEYVDIILSRSLSFAKASYFESESDARVVIKADNGSVYETYECGGGIYRTAQKIKAEKGVGYNVEIETADGQTYISGVETLVDTPKVKDISVMETTQTMVSVEYDGQQFSTVESGLSFSVAPEAVDSEDVGCLYRWRTLCNYLIVSEYSSGFIVMLNYYYCWKHKASESFVPYNLINYSTKENPPMFEANFCPYKYFNPAPIDSGRYYQKVTSVSVSSAYYCAEQYTMPKDRIAFWENVNKQSEASGKLFDPVDAQIEGNITCTSDSTKLAFGYFQVAGYDKKTILVYITGYMLRSVTEVDEFPETPSGSTFMQNECPDFWH